MTEEEVRSSAVLSDDGRYRYLLTRTWFLGAPKLTFVMLNPSTADASVDDPTIRRCMGFARASQFGGIRVVNLFAFRATDPKVMLRAIDPVGPENDGYIYGACLDRTVIAAWGANATRERVKAVGKILASANANVFSLGVTKANQPRHPLYVRGDQPFTEWSAAA